MPAITRRVRRGPPPDAPAATPTRPAPAPPAGAGPAPGTAAPKLTIPGATLFGRAPAQPATGPWPAARGRTAARRSAVPASSAAHLLGPLIDFASGRRFGPPRPPGASRPPAPAPPPACRAARSGGRSTRRGRSRCGGPAASARVPQVRGSSMAGPPSRTSLPFAPSPALTPGQGTRRTRDRGLHPHPRPTPKHWPLRAASAEGWRRHPSPCPIFPSESYTSAPVPQAVPRAAPGARSTPRGAGAGLVAKASPAGAPARP
jgi:hypothetical protein